MRDAVISCQFGFGVFSLSLLSSKLSSAVIKDYRLAFEANSYFECLWYQKLLSSICYRSNLLIEFISSN